MFDIGFDEKTQRTMQNDEFVRFAHITIGAFTERLAVPVSYWSEQQYHRSWHAALVRIIAETRSCLITGLRDPAHAPFVEWWPLYREQRRVFVQHHLLFLDEIAGSFDPLDPYGHIPERESVSEDGEPISEWEMSLDDAVTYIGGRR